MKAATTTYFPDALTETMPTKDTAPPVSTPTVKESMHTNGTTPPTQTLPIMACSALLRCLKNVCLTHLDKNFLEQIFNYNMSQCVGLTVGSLILR